MVEATYIRGDGTCTTPGGCSYPIDFSAGCFPDGDHTIVYNTTCSIDDGHGGCTQRPTVTRTTTFTTDQHPSISLSVVPTSTPAVFHGTVNYEFPGTDSWQGRAITVIGTKPDGSKSTYVSSDYQHPLNFERGTVEFDIDAECYPDGATTLVATATACNGDTKQDTQNFSINHHPQANLALSRNPDGSYKATMTYNFPDTHTSPSRYLALSILPSNTDNGGIIWERAGAFGYMPDASGTYITNLNLEGRRVVRFTALACGVDEVDQEAGVDCNNCCPQNSTGDPVQL